MSDRSGAFNGAEIRSLDGCIGAGENQAGVVGDQAGPQRSGRAKVAHLEGSGIDGRAA